MHFVKKLHWAFVSNLDQLQHIFEILKLKVSFFNNYKLQVLILLTLVKELAFSHYLLYLNIFGKNDSDVLHFYSIEKNEFLTILLMI
jgi:hypothetical protein